MERRSKKLVRGGVTQGFMDESGFSSTPYIARTWGLVGETPVVIHPYNWDKISVISVVTTTGKLYYRIHPNKTIKGSEVVAFLRQLLQQIEGNILLYWDGLPAHRSKKVNTFLAKHPRVQIRRFPSYSPELNPDEWVWNYVKVRELPNLAVGNTAERVKEIRRAMRRIQQRPELIQSFLFSSELPWNDESRKYIAQSF